ncbi:MAG: type II toxin-antitoxin system prevent-host-death family antitoxin [Chloroflexi bacterium]|nr:type II toxin-antitoxin system prevent-host-death family antitoxin [Chloroflexota bacterium]
MKRTTVAEAQSELRALIARARAGEEVEITDGGEPVARLVPVGAQLALGDRSAPIRVDEGQPPLNGTDADWVAVALREGVVSVGGGHVDPANLASGGEPVSGLVTAVIDERREGW